MIYRAAFSGESGITTDLAVELWGEQDVLELRKEFDSLLENQDCAIFLALDFEQAVGFAPCQLRHDYVEGTQSSPVGYLEGHLCKRGIKKTRLCARVIE